MFLDILEVVLGFEFGDLLGFGIHDPDHAIVEIDLIVPVHKPHIIGHCLIGIAQNKVHISLVFQNHVLEELEPEFRKPQIDLSHFQNLFPFLFGDTFAHPSGEAPDEMGCAASNGPLNLLGNRPCS